MNALPLLIWLVRRRWRGSTRLTLALASRVRTLQSVRVPTQGGCVILDLRELSSHGVFAGLTPESLERSWVASTLHPGDTAFVIGAHWGVYSVLLADLVGPRGRVSAFEPCPLVLPQLRKTVKPLQNVTLFESALADTDGSGSLAAPVDASMSALDTGSAADDAIESYSVVTATLDRLYASGQLAAPDFIKCDVEGAEALVMRGASALLDRHNAPTILFEHNPAAMHRHGLTPDATANELGRLRPPRYRFFLITRHGSLDPVTRLPQQYTDVVAVPGSRAAAT